MNDHPNNDQGPQNQQQMVIDKKPTSYTDMFNLAKRKDGSIMLSLISMTPTHAIENHRTVISSEVAKSLVDRLCQFTGYFPEPETKAEA